MPLEMDDRALNILGNGVRGLNFLDNDGVLRASIFLDDQNRLNIGDAQITVSAGGNGSAPGPPATPVHHHQLLGLLDDDHPQYIHRSSARTITARHTFNPASAASPFVLGANAQGQLVAGLNADLLRGLEPSNNPGTNERILKSTTAGSLTLQQLNVDNVRLDGNTLSAQTGDLTLTAAGGDVLLPSAINIGAANYISQLTGWRVTYAGEADFRYIFADELHVKAFIADIEQALAGGQIISKSVTTLSRNFTVPVGGRNILNINAAGDWFEIGGDLTAAIDVGQGVILTGTAADDGTYTVAAVTHIVGNNRTRVTVTGNLTGSGAGGQALFRRGIFVDDLPGFEDVQVFAGNDWVRLRVIDRSGGGLIVADVWGRVQAYADQPGGEQRWIFNCYDDGGVPGNVVNAGAIILDYGTSGDGYHEVTALDPDGPYSQIVTWQTNPTNPANYTLRSRLGNLDGVTDAAFPTIGGWGLYSDNAFMKGVVHAGGGRVVLNEVGTNIVVEEGFWQTEASLSFRANSVSGTLIGGLYSTWAGTNLHQTVLHGGNPQFDVTPRIVLARFPSGNAIEIAASNSVDLITNNINGGALRVNNVNGRVGVGTASPQSTLHVSGIATFNNGDPRTLNNSFLVGLPMQPGSGGWARGVFFRDTDDMNVNVAGVGAFGSGESITRLFMGIGASPWAGNRGITLSHNGSLADLGVNIIEPQNALDVFTNNHSNVFAARFFHDGGGSDDGGVMIQAGQDNNPTCAYLGFYAGDNVPLVGSVTGDGANGVNYNTTSDEKLKEDVTPMTAALDAVLALRPVEYRGAGTEKSGRKTPGLVAQEVMAAMPAAAAYDEENDVYTLAWNKVIPYLIGAIHDLAARIDELEVAA